MAHKKSPPKLTDLLNRIEREYEISMNCYTRYMWRPGTETGNREHARWERHQALMQQAIVELRERLAEAER